MTQALSRVKGVHHAAIHSLLCPLLVVTLHALLVSGKIVVVSIAYVFSYCLCIDNASGIHLAYLVRVGGHADAEGEPAEGGVRNLQGDRQGVAHRNEVPAMKGNLLRTSRSLFLSKTQFHSI